MTQPNHTLPRAQALCLLLLWATPSAAFVNNPSTTPRTQSMPSTTRRPTTARYFFNFDQSSSSNGNSNQKNAASSRENDENMSQGGGGLPAFFSSWATRTTNADTDTTSRGSTSATVSKSSTSNGKVVTTGMPDLISFLQPPAIATKEEETTTRPSKSTSLLSFSSSSSAATKSNDSSLASSDDQEDGNTAALVGVVGTVLVGSLIAFLTQQQAADGGIAIDTAFLSSLAQTATRDPQAALQAVLDYVGTAGSSGPLYFGIAYCVAEILAIPAVPLTMSAGFLFGTVTGTITVLLAATVAATVSFAIGKTVLRGFVEDFLREEENAKYAKIDRAIGEQGFPLLFLVRLTPIFPFALSNYVYGASSIGFVDFFFGTLFGFAPGTLGYVYTGTVGQELLLSGDNAQPWYVYAGALGALTLVLKLVTDAATKIVAELQEEDD